jgi:hypothetical protein
MAYQNYLGIRWQSAAQTVDLDFAHAGRNVSVAIPSDVTMDMAQAASLIDYLAKNDTELLSQTWDELINHGPDWRSRALEGLKALKELYPGVDSSSLRN